MTIGVDPYSINQSNVYKLYVVGGIRTEKVKVDFKSNWPDYVFSKEYKLKSIGEVSKYIKEHNQLPNMPSAQQVKDDGIDLGQMQSKLLQKIEELTLYVIEQNDRIHQLEFKISKLKHK